MNKFSNLFGNGKRIFLLPFFLLLIHTTNAWSQETTERAHFQIKIGASYDMGDYGTTDTTKVLFVPVTFRYLGERFDVSVTPSFARVDSTGGVQLIEGVPTPTGTASSTRVTNSGAGDTVVRSRFYLVEGTRSKPSISPFVKIKIPTSPSALSLGTGKTDAGFGVEVDHQISRTLLFGDLSYTFIGDVTGLNLRNRPAGSFGIGERITSSVVVNGMVDWRRSVLAGNPDPTDLVGVISYKVNRALTISPNVYVGLTQSTSDYGGGIEFSFRFARF